MSYYHSVRCLTCGETWEGGWENRERQTMQALAANGAALGAFAEALQRLDDGDVDAELKVGRVTLYSRCLAWFARHASCRLVEIGEDGVIDGMCGAHKPGGSGDRCVMGPWGHDSPHVWGRPPGGCR